ncbi:MAG: hypothetical protein AABY22_19875, partial [Nanoarchaeota archaeon]
KSWLPDVISQSGFKKIVRAGDLLDFYELNGLICLSLKHLNSSFRKQINIRSDVKKSSNAFEQESKIKLEKIYDIVKYNPVIKYKYKNEKEKHCELDFIVSNKNDSKVIICECKTSDLDIDNIQEELYINLLTHILQTRGDNREVRFRYIIEK